MAAFETTAFDATAFDVYIETTPIPADPPVDPTPDTGVVDVIVIVDGVYYYGRALQSGPEQTELIT